MLLLLGVSFFQISSGIAQGEGCLNPNACNYDSAVTIDDGSCTFPQWYLPEGWLAAPAVRTCTPPSNYVLAEYQCCVYQVTQNDSYCSETNWDQVCLDAYIVCVGNEFCDDPESCNYNPLVNCGSDNNCIYQSWHIPIILGLGAPVFTCESPVGYIRACQSCFNSIAQDDEECINTWSQLCHDQYVDCLSPSLLGCATPSACNYDPSACGDDGSCIERLWYYPENDLAGLAAVYSCNPPAGHVLADQCCMESMAEAYPNLASTSWEGNFDELYENCLNGCASENACNYYPHESCHAGYCIYPSWYLPEFGNTGPPVVSCERPDGYYSVSRGCCIQNVMDAGLCSSGDWDELCHLAYLDCKKGCTDPEACNYSPFASGVYCSAPCKYPRLYVPIYDAIGNPQLSCEDVEGYALADTNCVNYTLEYEDYNCDLEDWDPFCKQIYYSCTNAYGCTDYYACNYNYLSYIDDGSCDGRIGCTDNTAINYDPMANCNNGSCEFSPNCPGDFNNDGAITTLDLTGFLGVFGSTCD